MDEQFEFTDLAEQLRGPGGRELADKALARLGALQAETEAQLAQGLPPGEYDTNRRLALALAAAQRVMVAFSSTLGLGPRGGKIPPGNMGA